MTAFHEEYNWPGAAAPEPSSYEITQEARYPGRLRPSKPQSPEGSTDEDDVAVAHGTQGVVP